ncbi:hypothetical protein GHK65_08045 [Sinorhizobium meliloti]|uniref:DUF6946 family protein n=1 Tax=Rhizobium meliloti TaxID=382 RepID=UPI0012954480|nr:hypothetical protein [Sinorhizobium meliloti]MQV20294.1 hypothetical protein [Sinorhizobium meliloti]
MTKIYFPSSGPSDWQAVLADPLKHWRTGYSARTLAACWEAANGLPTEVAKVLGPDAELLIALPEHKVPLPRGRESQNDIFCLVRVKSETAAVTIEGKVNESFDVLTSQWLSAASEGKRERLRFLCAKLGLNIDQVGPLRYQLLHRTVSAIIEADRFKTDFAAMIVHSFSPQRLWFEDFRQFASALSGEAEPDQPCWVVTPTGRRLLLGWATGDDAFLSS